MFVSTWLSSSGPGHHRRGDEHTLARIDGGGTSFWQIETADGEIRTQTSQQHRTIERYPYKCNKAYFTPDGEMQIEDGQSLEDIKAKLKPKKPKIDVSMLDTSSSYDDKVVLMRMLVSEDSGKVAQVLKKMIGSNSA